MKWQLDWQDSKTDMETRMPAYSIPGFGTFSNRLQRYQYGEESYQLNTQFDKAISLADRKHQIVYGFSVVHKEVTNESVSNDLDNNTSTPKDYIPLVKARTYSLFLQDDIQLSEKLSLSPALRYDNYEYNPEVTSGFAAESEDVNKGKATARLGAVYRVDQKTSVFVQLSQGYKVPDVNDMFHTVTNFGYQFLANPDLKPEESNALELGVRGEYGLGSVEAAAFLNRYKNFIDEVVVDPNDPVLGVVYQMQNVDKAKIWGYELRTHVWLDEAIGAPSGTTFRGSLAYARGENTENDTPLNSISPLKVVLGLAYDAPSDTWGGELNWTLSAAKEEKDIPDTSEGVKRYEAPGYGIVDITAYYKPLNALTLRAGLFNLTDKKYWIWDDIRDLETSGRGVTPESGLDRYSQPGRNFSVSARYEF